jgi:Tol biopolymer transport system component
MKFFSLLLVIIPLFTIAQNHARLFEPELISDGGVFGFTLSPDGTHALWVKSKGKRDSLVIVESTKVKGKWQSPRIVPFSTPDFLWKDIDPVFAPDGKTVLFQSNRTAGKTPGRKGFDIWTVKKEGHSWSAPDLLESPVNSDSSESFASMARNGTMYFTIENGVHQGDIFVAEFKNGEYQTPVRLGAVINSDLRESNPFISPDEDYLIFVAGKPGNPADADLFITFKRNNEWATPVNLGEQVNSSQSEFCPFVHYKQDRIYFTRMSRTQSRNIENVYYYEGFRELLKKLRSKNDQ